MQQDLQAINIKPLRQTFDNLAERFGDKPATRYQEGTYDIQQTFQYHYRPTWDPEREIFDERRTAIRMKDWHDFKDPRQYYYGTYTIARSRQQDAADANFDAATEEGMAEAFPTEVRRLVLEVLLPARHAEWGANMNNTFISAYGYGAAINIAATFAAMDRLGIAQYISRIGLAVGSVEALDSAKDLWMTAPEWQPTRRYMEDMLVTQDWFELFVAQNVVLDAVLNELLYVRVAKAANQHGSSFYSLVTTFMRDWQVENNRWTDSVMKAAVSESPENKGQIQAWLDVYVAKAMAAVTPLAEKALGSSAAQAMTGIELGLKSRLQKAGL